MRRNWLKSAAFADTIVVSGRPPMNGVIYIVGLVVVVIAVLSFLGLR